MSRGKAFPLAPLTGWAVDKAQQAVALPTASRLRRACPICIKTRQPPLHYTGSCQQRIDSLRVADLRSLQAHT